jgi:hypothetical protein
MKICGSEVLFNFGNTLVHIPTGRVFVVAKIRIINEEIMYAGTDGGLVDQSELAPYITATSARA